MALVLHSSFRCVLAHPDSFEARTAARKSQELYDGSQRKRHLQICSASETHEVKNCEPENGLESPLNDWIREIGLTKGS
jgi:hypothetical protein